jgi:glutathione S-transferase
VLKLHDYLESGNGYKVRLLLHQLEIPYQRIEHDILRGETRSAEYLAKNPNGRIPLLELEDGGFLAESNAIQWYLAEGTPLLPEGRLPRAQVLQWMFFEQYSHEPYVAVVRFWTFAGRLGEKAAELPERRDKGYQALAVMEGHLARRDWFVGERYSIADIALYAYTHVAGEGGFELERFPAVRRWLARVAGEPRHIPITRG